MAPFQGIFWSIASRCQLNLCVTLCLARKVHNVPESRHPETLRAIAPLRHITYHPARHTYRHYNGPSIQIRHLAHKMARPWTGPESFPLLAPPLPKPSIQGLDRTGRAGLAPMV